MSEAQIAAKWWADKLRSKQQPGRDYTRPGENDPMAQMLVESQAKTPDFSTEQIEAFELRLGIALVAEIIVSQNGHEDFHLSIGVDYHPCDLLEDAARKAGIATLEGFLSWKTRMWISNGEVKVREGYGARAVYLLGYEKAMQEWEVRRQLWVDDENSERTEVLKEYPEYAKLPPAESFAKIVYPPVKYEED